PRRYRIAAARTGWSWFDEARRRRWRILERRMISEYSLTKANRIRLAQAFRNVPRVDISIECVLEDQMGMAYVDDVKHPSVYLIRIGPFHYFAGDVNSNGAQEMLKGFPPYNLFMSASAGWAEAFKSHYGERFIAIERYIFSSHS